MALVGTHQCQFVPYDEREAHSAAIYGFTHCKTHPGHIGFFQVSELNWEHLPPQFQTEDGMSWIRNYIDRTVKVKVSYTSIDRPDKFMGCDNAYPFISARGSNRGGRCGTGYVDGWMNRGQSVLHRRCPCPECKESNQPMMEYWEFKVSTATHLVYDKSEAGSTIFELFYDSDDNREGVKFLYGIDVLDDEQHRCRTDCCYVICITHDSQLAAILNRITSAIKPFHIVDIDSPQSGILISHPHGVSKMISFGRIYYSTKVSIRPGKSVKINKGCEYRVPASSGLEEITKNEGHATAKDNPPSGLEEITKNEGHTTAKDNPPSGLEEITKNEGHATAKDNPQCTDVANEQKKQLSDEENLQLVDTSEPRESVSLESCDSRLSMEITAIPPPTASFLYRSKYRSHWVVFPKGTKFVTREGIDVDVPPDTKFDRYGVEYAYGPHYITYDMASCPGSSGARVLVTGDRYGSDLSYCHYGCDEEEGYRNSGLNLWLGVGVDDVDDDDDDDGDDDDDDDDDGGGGDTSSQSQLGSILPQTSVLPRESRMSPVRFMLQKPG